uniref:Uncharacterized protein n=1 Tax=Echeneis naucrates TaxID=173247 RepID=A0A665TVD1_ECHNA
VCGGRDHFLCATGICIPQKLVCNGYNDCDDWNLSDERNCGETHTDTQDFYFGEHHEHRCGDGRCVSRNWLCDGDNDCLDKTDELNCCETLKTLLLLLLCNYYYLHEIQLK